MRNDLDSPWIGQVFVHRIFHLFDPFTKILMVLFEFSELLQSKLEELGDAQAGELRAAQFAEDLPQHCLVLAIHHRPITGHLTQERILGAQSMFPAIYMTLMALLHLLSVLQVAFKLNVLDNVLFDRLCILREGKCGYGLA